VGFEIQGPTEQSDIGEIQGQRACVVLSSSNDKATANPFLGFVKTESVVEMLKKYGF